MGSCCSGCTSATPIDLNENKRPYTLSSRNIEVYLKKLKTDAATQESVIKEVRIQATQFTPRLSKQDQALVEDRISGLEKKQSSVCVKAEKRENAYKVLGEDLIEVHKEVEMHEDWLNDQGRELEKEEKFGHHRDDVSPAISDTQAIIEALKSKQSAPTEIAKNYDRIKNDLTHPEQSLAQDWISGIQSQQRDTLHKATLKKERLDACVVSRVNFHKWVDAITDWLSGAEVKVEQFAVPKLKSPDVKRQQELCKNLTKEIQQYKRNISKSTNHVGGLRDSCNTQANQDISAITKAIEDRYTQLLTNVRQSRDRLKGHLSGVTQLETDMTKMESCLQECDARMDTLVEMGNTVEVLNDQKVQLQSLSKTSAEYLDLVDGMDQRADTLSLSMADPDAKYLHHRLKTLQDKHSVVAQNIEQQLQRLDIAMDTQSQMRVKIERAKQWLAASQSEMRSLNKPLPYDIDGVRDMQKQYEDLKDRLNEFSGDITDLNTNVESLQAAGQDLDADAIVHLASQHALLMDQVSQQVDQCEQAVSLRQQFLQYKSELEEVIQACETRVKVIKQPGVTNDDKINGYKEVLAKFNAADQIMVVLSEKGYQVSVEGSPSDCEVVSSQLEVLKHEVEHLKASIEAEYSQCEQIRKERENFATMTAKSIDWLEQRCEMMATKGPLDVDAEKVEALQRKHHNLEDEVMSSLSETYSRTKLQEMSLKEAQEPVPQSLIDHLSKLSDLKERIQVVAEEKDQYLGNAKANRAELEQSLKQVTAWLRGADDLLNNGQDGLDYDTLQTSLQEHKEYFSEASLCQDEVEHINELADLILPTVDENDRATLQQSLRNVNHKVNEAIRSAQNKQDTMETKLAEWNEYQDLVQGVTQFLTECEEKWACLDGAVIHTQSDTLQQIADVKEFKETLDSRRDAIDRLNDIGRGLDRCCNDSGRKVLGQQIHSVNQRWHDLVNHAQNKLDATKELDERYRLFDETLASVQKTLREADQTSDTKDILTLPSQQLTERLALTKDSSRTIQACLDQIHEMKKEADMLIPDIPGAEAKVELQRCMIEVMEEQGSLSEKTHDYEQSLQDEVDARDKFKTDMSQATAALHQIDKQLTNPSVAQKSLPLNEKLAKNKEIHADIDQRIQTIDSRAASLKDKYTSEGASLPADIGTQLQDLVSLRDTLRDKLKKDNELMEQKRLAKEEFDKLSRELNETVVNCTGALVSKVDLSPESIQKHKDLGLELEVCLEKLKLLKPMSDNLVENSRDKSERKRIRRTVNELDEKLRNLDARYKKQTESFNKASELSHTLSVALAPIVEKTGVLNEEIQTPIDNADLTHIFPNIERCSASLTDIEKQLKNLKTMKRQVSELDRLCGASSERVTINETSKTLQELVKQAKDRLHMLEKASGVLDECECEFRSACDLIGETNTMMSSNMSDTSLGDQVPLLQGLLSRLEIKRDKVDEIARNHPETLHVVPKTAMSVSPDQLPTELRNKIAAVSRHLQQTQRALAEYEQQDEQIRKLTEAIGLAEERLNVTVPLKTLSIENLQKEMEKHKELASKIGTYHSKITDLNDAELTRGNYGLNYDTIRSTPLLSSVNEPLISSSSTKDLSKSSLDYPDSGIHLSDISHSDISIASSKEVRQSSLSNISDVTQSFSVYSKRSDGDSTLNDTASNLQAMLEEQLLKDESATDIYYSPSFVKTQFSDTLSENSAALDDPVTSFNIQEQFTPLLTSQTKSGNKAIFSPSSLERSIASQPLLVKSTKRRSLTSAGSLESVSSEKYGPQHRRVSGAQWNQLSHDQMTGASSEPNLSFKVQSALRTPALRDSSRNLVSQQAKLAELNKSWNKVQKLLTEKESCLKNALENREGFQQAARNLSGKIESSERRLKNMRPSVNNVHDLLRQHEDIEADIGTMKNDLSQLKQHGVAIIAGSDKDDSSSTALKASLNSLDKRIAALEELADEKAEQLKDAVRDKERHNTELQAYQKRVADEHSWLDQARVDLVSTPEPYDSVDVLKQQQTDLKDLHHNLNQRLTRLPELAVQCDQLCAHETPENARKLRDDLLRLQTGLGDAKMELLGRQARLKQALRESERRQDELAEYNDSVRKLQDWIEETKKLTLSPGRVDASALASRREDAKKSLEQGLSEHRRLLETLPEVPVATSDEASNTPNAVGTWSELQGRWESLSNELARKRLLSEDAVTKMIENDSVSGSHRQIWSPTSFQTLTSSTTQIHDVRHLLGELSECWRGLQDQVEDKQSELDDVLSRHQKLQDSLAVTSAWLDDAEMKLVTPSDEMSCQDRLQETENLLDDMKRLRGEIAEMGHVSQDMLSAVSTGSRVLITRSLTDLAGRVQTLEIQATQHEAHIQDTDRQLKEFQQEVHALDTGLKEILGEYNDLDDTLAFSDALDKYLHMEYQLRLYERKLHRLQTQARELTITDPRLSVTLDLASLHKHFTDLQSMVHSKRDDLQKFYVVQEKYGKMLDDYTQFLETSQGKLKTESVTAKDLHHLKQQLSSHKDFFSDLDEHKSLLDSLERQCDHGTIDKLAVEQSHAQNLTAVVRDKASLHAQKLERLVRQWTDVEMKLAKMTRLLTDGENQLPKPVSDADSLDAVREKLAVYKRIARALGDERSSVQEIIERGKNLVKSVSCPALEMTIAEFSNKWLELNKSVNDELKKCETLAEQWHTFDTDAAMLESWLISAKVEISGIKQLSDADTKSIANIRAKVDRVVEFRKEVESQYPLKTTVFASGQQLLRFKKSDSPRIERKLKEFGDHWDRLVKEVNNTEEFLHQAQMDLMPSRQALSEIVIWVDEVEKTLRDDKYSSVAGSPEVELMLKKYKGYKIDIASKQLTVDFVNQAATQLVQEPGDLMRDGTEFAEKLGQLNRRWQSVKIEVNEKHKSLELSYNKWLDYERAIKGLQTWLRDQEDRVKKFHLIGNESNVKTTLRDCKTLQAALSGKERDIESIRKDGMNLVDVAKDSPRCIQMIRDTAEKMKQQWSNLDQQLSHLQGVLEEVLVQWNNYHVEQQTLGHVLSETEYCLGKYAAATMDVNTLNVHVAKLKNLQSEFDKSSGKLDKFSTLSNQLMHVCDSPVKRELVTTLSDVKTKWTNLSSQVASRITKLEQTIKDWLRYNEEHDREAAWLEARETQLSELETMRDTPGDRQRCLDQCKTLQLDLDNFQSQLVALGRLGDDIVEGFDSPLAGVISSRQKILSQRLATLRHALTKHVHALHDDLTDYKKFETSFDAVAKYLDGVERDLSKKDPDKMADEATIKRRLDELCDLSHQFTRRQQDLDALNDMGYRMALSEAHAGKLLGLNHRWHGLLGDTAERYRAMQGLMLMQQDFHQKREMWMAFLTLAERDLTCDIAGNYKELCEQQRKCEQFQVEVYNKQQILQSILTDGQRMLRLGDVPDHEDFQRKLTALSDQWQNVVLKADRFKAVIDDAVVLWQTYFALSDRINTWLANREFDLGAYDLDKTTLQKIKYLLEKSRSSLSDFNSQENNYKKIHTVSRELLQQTDADAERELRANLSTLQQRWYQAFGTFDGHRERLEDVMNQWQQCEDDIEDIVNWLREIRLVLCADVPASYEALQRELHKCKDFEATFANSEDKRHVLHARQTQLAGLVEAEDLAVLNERVRLLDKQWEELRSQVCERRDAVEGRLDHWQRFTRRFRVLCEWIDETEAKLSARSDVTVEDLLAFIEQDYQQMITDKEVEVVELTEEGRRLVRASADTRANDIHQKLATLEDKWQHLKTLFNNRRSKLQETLATIRQLEMSMSGLRKWLAQREYELAQPLSYADCESKEITNKLDKHQELHRDIERHSAGVTSVLNLCEVLLQDSEACPAPSDYSALDKANRSLDKRWRNICVLATERRNLIEDTWHKWEKLMGDCSDFSKWVREVEAQVRPVRDDHSDVTTMKEEIRYFEALEHKVHDHITYLEDINKQYRLLAREGRTDNSGTLKASMQEANDRWDALLKRITATQLGLKRNTGMLDDFARKREDLMAWLRSTLDQLMDTEFSEDITPALKVASAKKLKRSFESRLPEVDSLDKMAVLLMEQCEPSESSRVESQIDELHRCKREVVDALKLCLMKLHQTLESKKKKTKSSKDKDVPDAGRQVYTDPGRYRHSATEKQRVTAHVTPIPSHRDTAKNTPEKRSGRRGDKSGSKMDVRIEELAQALEDAAEKLLMVETELRCVTPTGPDTEFAPQEYIRLLVDCEESIEYVRQCEERLKSVSSNVPLSAITSQVTSLMNRWEILNARAVEKDTRLLEHRENWSRFQADINTMSIWLSEAHAYRDNDRLDVSELGYKDTSLERRREFDAQLDDMRALLMTLNVTSKAFVYNRSPGCRETRARLHDINTQWERLYSGLHTGVHAGRSYRGTDNVTAAGGGFDTAKFHYTIHDSLRWLEGVETAIQHLEPVTTISDATTARSTLRQLVLLNEDMEHHEPVVTALRETADQLLLTDPSPETSQARDKSRIICNRLRSLKRRCQAYIAHLDNKLFTHPAPRVGARGYGSPTSLDTATVLRSPLLWPRKLLSGLTDLVLRRADSAPLLPNSPTTAHESSETKTQLTSRRRILLTFIPLIILVLLLLLAAWLTPVCDDDCIFANNFKWSLSTMKVYPNGPPPT